MNDNELEQAALRIMACTVAHSAKEAKRDAVAILRRALESDLTRLRELVERWRKESTSCFESSGAQCTYQLCARELEAAIGEKT